MKAPAKHQTPESELFVTLRDTGPELEAEAVCRQLAKLSLDARPVPARSGETWRVAWTEGTLSLVERVPARGLHTVSGDFAPDARRELEQARRGLRLGQRLASDAPLRSYHAALRVLDRLAPECAAFFDDGPGVWRAGDWLRSVARSPTAPPVSALFMIHLVVSRRRVSDLQWLHTHGVRRCSGIELDVLDVPSHAANRCAELVNQVAAYMLGYGVPPPGKIFVITGDLEVAWLPWRVALQHLPRRGLGRREDRDTEHDQDHAALLTRARHRKSRRGPAWRSAADLFV